MSNSDYTVELYPGALKDLDGIYAYYYRESQDLSVAEKVTGKIKSAMYSLSFMPASHPAAHEARLRFTGIRKLICGEFVVPFIIDEEKKVVSIVRVFHGKMNYQKYL
ncbi:MAG: type II toxin-antitoxin system RelE/ParE family toxin [Firmicutes bacterium]|nr:type II toxin-antitoxin system RelE/ParE family toxin [Bacillota bacterium]